tara:strand:- start:686 stop:1543 length:858 start_codon:yes stop_codon:yes gene_type:complete
MKTTEKIFNDWLESEETKKKNLSNVTIDNYRRTVKNIGFGILNGQESIIKKLKSNYDNPNTLSSFLNMIIILREFNDKDTDKLIKLRNDMKKEIIQLRKEKLKEADKELPSLEEIKKEFEKLDGIQYIINYLILNYGFRNKDLNLVYVDKLPEEKTQNYITPIRGGLKLSINDYKTNKSYNEKVIKITDKEFSKKFKSMKYKDGDYIIANKNNKPYGMSNFNNRVLKNTIFDLGEAKLFKIVIKDLIDSKNFERIAELSKTRGTDFTTIMSSYNIYNNGEKIENK